MRSPNDPDSVDLRSDTVTRPTPAMYAAMAAAPVGDDVLGDDPTVFALEALAARMTGKEAAVFVPSGTMGNQIAVASHTSPGDAILIEEEAHILYYEVGAPAVLSNVVSWTLPSSCGVLEPDVIAGRVLKRSLHTPGTALLCLENTHNRAGGTVTGVDRMAAYRGIADQNGMRIHLDGARVFNAAVALGVPVEAITRHVDSVNFCLSKGLCSPVGSVLCGARDFIERARIWRKRLGGGMRQAGILAACGIVSLESMVDRLREDHARATRIAQAISELPGIRVDLSRVHTNIVLIETALPAVEWQEALAAKDTFCLPAAPNRLRLVLHADVDDVKLERAIQAFSSASAELGSPTTA